MDDIVTCSREWPDVLTKLETILKTLDSNNLSCQPGKCSFAFPSITFLGVEVSRHGLKITDDKIKILRSLKPPKDKKSLQKTFGVFNFMRQYCPLFAKSTYNMRRLLKDGVPFVWSSECQVEFDNMIFKLTNAPVLQPLNVNADFHMYTDASYFGTGFAVFQPSGDDPMKLRVVGYGGNALTESHRSWSVMQIELMAVYMSLKAYEPYCRHRTIHIYSDNISLVYLRGVSLGTPREKRMASYIMGFRLQFHHVSGKHQNMLADVISRSFEDMTPSERELWVPHTDPRDDFLFAINSTGSLISQKDADNATSSLTSDTSRTSEVNSWQNYSISYDFSVATDVKTDSILNNIYGDYTPAPKAEMADTWYDCSTDFVIPDEQIKSVTNTDLFMPSNTNDACVHVQSICNATKARRHSKQQTTTTPDIESATDPTTLSALPTDRTDNFDEMLTVPSVSPSDYESDPYLSDMYMYLSRGILPVINEQARVTLLLSEDFIIHTDGLLYRISVPRGKKQARVMSTEVRLALPQKYLAEVVEQTHHLGHFSKERNFQFLRSRFYAKNLFDAVNQFQNTCGKCQRFKRDNTKKPDKLHSLPIPSAPGQQWAVDHLILTRPTVDGHTAIIVFIDAFSKWPVIRLVKSTSAIHAAEAFVEGVISVFGLSPSGQLTLNSDKGSAFVSNFFKTVCKLLGVRLITSASQISTSNGLAESLVKATKQGIKMFADTDVQLRAAIPLIELSLRARLQNSVHSKW
jgi:hypothetical protein